MMSIVDRIDPEIAPVVAAMPDLDITELPHARTEYWAMFDSWPVPSDARVLVRDMTVPPRGEHPSVRVRVFSPAETPRSRCRRSAGFRVAATSCTVRCWTTLLAITWRVIQNLLTGHV